MSKNDLIGNAGVYWVVSELSLRGLVALPTVRNCPGADVLVLDPDTGGLATLQVKTSGKRPTFWPASEPSGAWRKPSHSYVFVRRNADWSGFEAFHVSASVAAEDIASGAAWRRETSRKPFGCWVLPKEPEQQEALRAAWRNWKPPAR